MNILNPDQSHGLVASDTERLFALYTQRFGGVIGFRADALPRSGSPRRYYRIVSEGHEPCIGCCASDAEEAAGFVMLSRFFRDKGVSVPEVIACSDDRLTYLQQDCGSTSLFDVVCDSPCGKCGERVLSGEAERGVVKAMRDIAAIHELDIAEAAGFMYPSFDRTLVLSDFRYFIHKFLLPMRVDFDAMALRKDSERLADMLLSYPAGFWGFMYRDFQSRNVMLSGGENYYIDFQSGRPGPGLYDVASMLWQAKASFSDEFRTRMVREYVEARVALRGNSDGFAEAAEKYMPYFVLFRALQTLGAYGLRGLVEGKRHFLESIPYGIRNLRRLVESGVADMMPELKRVVLSLPADFRREKDAMQVSGADDMPLLTVSVISFSYKKGYPEDSSGNGGGYMFDCRCLHNPGRYAPYRDLTGMDMPVREFLQTESDISSFMDSVISLADAAVAVYKRRGFTNLQFGFGCTGGQHRSVYAAEWLAAWLGEHHKEIKVILTHREQGRSFDFTEGERRPL